MLLQFPIFHRYTIRPPINNAYKVFSKSFNKYTLMHVSFVHVLTLQNFFSLAWTKWTPTPLWSSPACAQQSIQRILLHSRSPSWRRFKEHKKFCCFLHFSMEFEICHSFMRIMKIKKLEGNRNDSKIN